MNLGELKKGQKAKVKKVGGTLAARLLEMGFFEGTEVEVVHEAPLSADPIAVQTVGGMIALRRVEAAQIEVTLDGVAI